MQYLSSAPMVFTPSAKPRKRKEVEEKGGLAAAIPKKDQCASGRHNKRLTECLCALFEEK